MEIVILLSVILNAVLLVRIMVLRFQKEQRDNEIYNLLKDNKKLKNENESLKRENESLDFAIEMMDEVEDYITRTSKVLINKLAQALDKHEKKVGYSSGLLLSLDVIPKVKKNLHNYTVNHEKISSELIGAAPEKPRKARSSSSMIRSFSIPNSSNNNNNSSSISSAFDTSYYGHDSYSSSSSDDSSSSSSSSSNSSYDSGGSSGGSWD